MLDWLYYIVAAVLRFWHYCLSSIGLGENSGLNWSLSIILLVVTARLLLFRLFIRQVHYQRRMQELQPRLTAIRNKYKDDKAAQQREMMALQQQEGFNPLAGCLPLVAQLPVFIGLLHVLRHLAAAVKPGYPSDQLSLYGLSAAQTHSAASATFFGAPLSADFWDRTHIIGTLHGDLSTTRVVIMVLLVVSALATWITQRQVMSRQTTTPEGTAALVQKAMQWLIPVGVFASGLIFGFPLGVLLYWFTSNVWTMAQQFYINKFHPNTPGSGAAKPATAGGPDAAAARALAPRPGQKPVRPSTGKGATTNLSKDPTPPATTDTDAAAAGSAKPNTPKPGQKPATGKPAGSAGPNGTAGNRRPQPGRKPGQAKKRR